MVDWEVFARSELSAPVRHVGTVAADRPEDAEVFACKLYDEWSWKEMFVVPRQELVRVGTGGSAGPRVRGKHLVFGRQEAGDLQLLGDVEAGSGLAKEAVEDYRVRWADLTLVPVAAIRWVLGPARDWSNP